MRRRSSSSKFFAQKKREIKTIKKPDKKKGKTKRKMATLLVQRWKRVVEGVEFGFDSLQEEEDCVW